MSEHANVHTDNGSQNVDLRQLVCFRLGEVYCFRIAIFLPLLIIFIITM